MRRRGDRIWVFIGHATVAGKLAAEAILQAMIVIEPT
jgi:hypothetical protein